MPLPQPPKRDSSRFDDWMFSLWKQIADIAGSMASIAVGGGAFATGSFTLPDGTFLIVADTFALTGTQVATLEGSAVLTIV